MRIQRKLITLLESKDWLVAKAEVGGKFVKEKDMFGLFDLCCLKPGTVLFVQVTTNRNHPHKKYKEFANKYGTDQIWIEQYVWVDYVGFKRFIYYPNNIMKKVNIN